MAYLYGFWGSDSDSPVAVAGTLPTEPHKFLVLSIDDFLFVCLFLNRTGS